MTDEVRAAVLVAPGRYEVQEFPRPTLADGAAAAAGRDVGHLRHRQAHLPRRDQAVRRHAGRDRHPVPDHPGPRERRRGRRDHARRPRNGSSSTGAGSPSGDRITMCPDVVCGRCYPCTHVMGYVWCDNSAVLRQLLHQRRAAAPARRLGGVHVPAAGHLRLQGAGRAVAAGGRAGRADGLRRQPGQDQGVLLLRDGGLQLRRHRRRHRLRAARPAAHRQGRHDGRRPDHRHRPQPVPAGLGAALRRRRDARRVLDHRRGTDRSGPRADRRTGSRRRAAHGEHAARPSSRASRCSSAAG